MCMLVYLRSSYFSIFICRGSDMLERRFDYNILGTSSGLKHKRSQTQKHIHSSRLYQQKALSYLKSNQKIQTARDVSKYSYNKEIDILRGYQKEIGKALAERKPDKKSLGKIRPGTKN